MDDRNFRAHDVKDCSKRYCCGGRKRTMKFRKWNFHRKYATQNYGICPTYQQLTHQSYSFGWFDMPPSIRKTCKVPKSYASSLPNGNVLNYKNLDRRKTCHNLFIRSTSVFLPLTGTKLRKLYVIIMLYLDSLGWRFWQNTDPSVVRCIFYNFHMSPSGWH